MLGLFLKKLCYKNPVIWRDSFIKISLTYSVVFAIFTSMLSTFFPKKYLGLDIGNSAVKIAEVAGFRNRIAVTRLIKAQLPPQDPEQPRDMSPVALTLQLMVQKHQLRDKRVCSNLSGAYVASRLFTLPAMTHDELLAYIRNHAYEYFPASVNINEVEF
ncbi:MAG: hypothetical protein HY761_10255, partial [Candidatus Omnitrophica bacterium]|nr:hypothetical protein [Candidatus Omnitrophota bacterium]